MNHGIIRLQNRFQHYDWGTVADIPQLLNFESSDQQTPLAELWIGAHSRLPSYSPDHGEFLDALLMAHTDIVSHACNVSQLPYLLKVLSAGRPLSLQVHPSKSEAEAGFAREQRLAIPLDATQRNYKDSNHKPEMLYALTPFAAMAGFRTAANVAALLQETRVNVLAEWAERLLKVPHEDTMRALFRWLISRSAAEAKAITDDVLCLSPKFANGAFYWLHQLADFYPGDIGLLFPLLLNIIHLQPGEAIYLGAGCLHAYLKGSGIEVMASSDNVLRGGLTNKHIDREELSTIVKFDELTNRIRPVESYQYGLERRFPVPCKDFQLSIIELTGAQPMTAVKTGSAELYLVIRGNCEIANRSYKSGDAFLIPAGTTNTELSGYASVVRVRSELFTATDAMD